MGYCLNWVTRSRECRLKKALATAVLVLSVSIKYTEHYLPNISLTDKTEHIRLFTIQPVKVTGNYDL